MSLEYRMKYHKLSTRTRFSCDKCEKTFFRRVVYERHLLTHLPDEEHKFESDADGISETDRRGE